MGQERRMILSLVASGRITAGEAERLLAAASERWEWVWMVAACALLGAAPAIVHGLPGIGQLAHALAAGWGAALQHAAIEIGKGMGGLR
jgi:hypothetical protein